MSLSVYLQYAIQTTSGTRIEALKQLGCLAGIGRQSGRQVNVNVNVLSHLLSAAYKMTSGPGRQVERNTT